MKSHQLLIGLAVFLLHACTKEVKIDLPPFEQKIVVDGRIEVGMPPVIILSRSQNLYSSTSLDAIQNNFVSGAQILVSDGSITDTLEQICTNNLDPSLKPLVAQFLGVSESDLDNFNYCAYTSFNAAIFGVVGKTYSLTINVEGKTYTSKTTIMPPPTIDSTYFKYNGTYTDRGYAWIVIDDNPNVYNTYFAQVKSLVTDTRFFTPYGPAFDDEYFNGLKFKFGIPNAGSYQNDSISKDMQGYFKVGDTAVVSLSSMDLDVYNFMLQKYAQVDNGGNPFASPANIPTNIVGGALGVWAGFAATYDTIPCYP